MFNKLKKLILKDDFCSCVLKNLCYKCVVDYFTQWFDRLQVKFLQKNYNVITSLNAPGVKCIN